MNALGKIQSEIKAPKGQHNSFGKYNYRSCEDILEAVKPLLKKHDACLTISDTIEEVGGRIYVKATVMFEGGDGCHTEVTAYAREAETKKGMDEAQITGAASSYARKYALSGLLCLDDTKDADTQDNRPHQAHQPDPTAVHREHYAALKAELLAAKDADAVNAIMKNRHGWLIGMPEKGRAELNALAMERLDKLAA